MPKQTSAAKLRASFTALCLLGFVTLACKSLPGRQMNMFEGANAQDGAAKVKAKLGVDSVKVSRIEIHADEMSIVVQDPAKPRNFDEYTWQRGSLSGPKPVPALVIGNNEITADRSQLFDLNETNLGAVADVCRKVKERARISDGKCELITVNWESARWTRTKEENDKIYDQQNEEFRRKVLSGKLTEADNIRHTVGDLAVTWRVYIRGTRANKDYWVDLKGNVWDYQ